ncbi:MAG: ferrous iron transport protein A [Verrucomicrobiales bacterium]|jgi:Fe2+ transport system protein FeoA|nr:ferrous iron transport protein A [Verrucomicrobiales bacterium]
MQTLLSSVRCGTKGVVTALDDFLPATKRLRRLGIHEGMPVEVLHGDDPMMILCHRSKIAVSRDSLDAVTISVKKHSCEECYFPAAFFNLFRFKTKLDSGSADKI